MAAPYKPGMRPSLEDRFWPKVDRNGPVPAHVPHLGSCWVWIGRLVGGSGRRGRGYGVIKVDGKEQRAHRLSWELHHGPIRNKLFALHHCDNPRCVNPAHLFLGTDADNALDKQRKERTVARITGDAIRSVFRDRASGLSQREIADRHGVSQPHVSRLLRGKRRRITAARLGLGAANV